MSNIVASILKELVDEDDQTMSGVTCHPKLENAGGGNDGSSTSSLIHLRENQESDDENEGAPSVKRQRLSPSKENDDTRSSNISSTRLMNPVQRPPEEILSNSVLSDSPASQSIDLNPSLPENNNMAQKNALETVQHDSNEIDLNKVNFESIFRPGCIDSCTSPEQDASVSSSSMMYPGMDIARNSNRINDNHDDNDDDEEEEEDEEGEDEGGEDEEGEDEGEEDEEGEEYSSSSSSPAGHRSDGSYFLRRMPGWSRSNTILGSPYLDLVYYHFVNYHLDLLVQETEAVYADDVYHAPNEE